MAASNLNESQQISFLACVVGSWGKGEERGRREEGRGIGERKEGERKEGEPARKAGYFR